jgi:cytochrome b involved in lipid metabolism
MSKSFSVAEVAKHKDEKESLYIIVDSDVYDITSM